jgi:hypothetical protein
MSEETELPRAASDLTEHPLMLTTLVVYSIVLGLPLDKFPPITLPQPTDVLIFATVVLLLTRTILTYHFARAEKKYPERLFLMEISTALIVAAEFRVLLDDKTNTQEGSLWLFYCFHLLLIGTMTLWGVVLHHPVSQTPLYLWVLRLASAIASIIGIAIEWCHTASNDLFVGRWIVSAVLIVLSLIYAVSRPWRQARVLYNQKSISE